MPELTIEEKLKKLGLVLPAPVQPPGGAKLPFAPVRILGNRVLISGHSPNNPDGSLATPLGKLGGGISVEQGYAAARLCALSMLGSLQRAIGDLDRVAAWVKILGFVNSGPGFTKQPAVINGCSELILELYGPERGAHARSAIGVAELPFNIPVEVEAELYLK